MDLSGPGGLSLTTPTSALAAVEDGGRAFVNRDPTTNSTFIQLQPATGTYTATLAAGSAAVTATSQSTALPQPQISASVTGPGTRRTLHWSATAIPGQTLSFVVQSSSGTVPVTTTSATRGAVGFTIAPGLPGLATVTVQVQEDGFERGAFEVATFPAPTVPPPHAPSGLSIARHGSIVTIEWRSGGASIVDYDVEVTTTSGVHEVVDLRAPVSGS